MASDQNRRDKQTKSNNNSQMHGCIEALTHAGVSVIPVHKNDKAPTQNNWSVLPTLTPEQVEIQSPKWHNYGIRPGAHSKLPNGDNLICIDLDIKDPKAEKEALKQLDKLIPGINKKFIVVHSGNRLGLSRHYIGSTDKPLRSGRLWKADHKIKWHDGKMKDAAQIDIIGTGKQFVGPGSMHPDGNRYELDDEDDFFEVVECWRMGKRTAFIDSSKLWTEREDTGTRNRNVANDNIDPVDKTDDEIFAVLDDLPEDYLEDRDKWLDLGFALNHQFQDHLEFGLQIWRWYSKKSTKYDEEDLVRVWRSFKDDKERQSLTFRSIIRVVNNARRKRALESVGDEFEAVKVKEANFSQFNIGTDTENAVAFAAVVDGDLLFKFPGPVPHFWDGNSYVECRKAEHILKAFQFAQQCVINATKISDETARTSALKKATRLNQRKAITDMLKLAESLPKLKAHESEFDLDPMLAGVSNGVIDLRTGRLIVGNRAQRISRRLGVAYDSSAKAPQFEKFLREVLPDKEVREFLQRATGYTLTGSMEEDATFFLTGTGANGKTVFMDALARVLGDYRHTLNNSTLLKRKYDNDESMRDIVQLRGRRLALVSEIKSGEIWNDGIFKMLAQTSEITGRDLYQSKSTFKPTHKIWICANNEPRADDQSDGLWRRMCKVPFGVTIPEEKQDKKLGEKLVSELPGILNCALQGLADWRENGLQVPDAVRLATQAYRKDNDSVAAWAEQQLEPARGKLTSKDAFGDYRQWCEGQTLHYVDQQSFGLRMRALGHRSKKGSKGNFYDGLRIANLEGFED